MYQNKVSMLKQHNLKQHDKFNQHDKSLRLLSVVFLLSTLTACGIFGGDERPVYQGAEYYKNLEVPPDLTAPDTADQLRVPKPTKCSNSRTLLITMNLAVQCHRLLKVYVW